jgi:hypothetical protein
LSLVRVGAAIVAICVAGLVLGITVLAGSVADSSSAFANLATAAQACSVEGAVPGLTSSQAANADVVVAVTLANSAGSEQAARIALMTAYTESQLVNLGPEPGNDGSLGLFQQRSSQGWGTVGEEQDPAEATAMFVGRLVTVPGWTTLPPWVAAQDVQRSAFADGSNYEANWPLSGALLAAVLEDGQAPAGCGQGLAGGLAGPASAYGLPAGYAIPAGTEAMHSIAVRYALAELGKPYVWGAAGPEAFDCSGLTMAAWAAAGVHLLHYTVDQLHEGQPVAPADAAPGDLVLIPGADPPGPGLPGHVGVYLGYGLVESAVDPQEGVVVQTWRAFTAGGVEGVVDPAPGP